MNIEKIRELFPNVVTERRNAQGKLEYGIDFELLKQELSEELIEGREERYQFTWPDKREAIRMANTPSTQCLRPCREESVDFDNTKNLYIEGDNLEVLKLLRENYLGKVKMIYIDPPYNTGNDFVYNDDFVESVDSFKERDGQKDELGNRLFKNTDSNGRFHTDWLNMMYPRLKVARDLLSEDGVIFISIDDNEVDNLKKLCNEIFGERNFAGNILWKKKTNGNNMGLIPPVHDYILVFCKNIELVGEIGFEINDTKGYSNPDDDPRGLWTTMDLSANHKGPYFGIENPQTGEKFFPAEGRYWVFNENEVKKRIKEGKIIFGKSGKTKPVQKVFLSDRGTRIRKAESWWDKHGMNEDATTELKELFGVAKIFSHPKPVELLYNLLSIVIKQGDIVLDFFSGSGTLAHALFKKMVDSQINYHFILVQLQENLDEVLKRKDTDVNSKAYIENAIAFLNSINKPHFLTEIGKERIRRAGTAIRNEELGERNEELVDVGFRVLKLDSSNMKDVYYCPEEIGMGRQDLFEENIKEDRSAEDLLFQVMPELGIELSVSIRKEELGMRNGVEVFNVGDGYLMACFDNELDEEIITEIAKRKPAYFVTRDRAFGNDAMAVNMEQIFTKYSPDTVRRVI